MHDDGLRYSRRVDGVCRKIASEWVLVPVDSEGAEMNAISVLNTTGKIIWDCLEKEADLPEIMAVLREHVTNPDAVKEGEILGFLQEAVSGGVLNCS